MHPTELGIKRWSKDVTPQEVTEKAIEKALNDFGIKDANLRKQALDKLSNRELGFELGREKAQKTVKTGDFGKRDLMLVGTNKLGGIDVQFNAAQVNWLKSLAQIEKVNESAAKREANLPLISETTILGSTATLSLPKAIELPQLAARPLLILGAEAALPAAVIGTQVGAIAWTADQIATNAHRKWEQETRINSLPLPSTVLTNKAEEPAKPETAVADKTKPQAQPIPDEVDLPKGELAVRPKAQPQTSTKADNPTAPTIENVPPAYKPSQPNL